MSIIPTGVSVIVCCYNSEKRIEKTLEHLLMQKKIKSIAWEIILVNNASTDNTVNIVREKSAYFKNKNISFKIINEELHGLNHARKRGIKESLYSVIIFCDDDNWLNDQYIFTAYNLIKNNRQIGIAGGMSIPYFEIQPPQGFEHDQEIFAIGSQSSSTGIITPKGYAWGAGMIARKHLLLNVFDENYPMLLGDRNKNLLTSGGDTEICLRIVIQGYDLYYNEDLQFTHFIPKERLTAIYKENLKQGITDSHQYLSIYHRQLQINKLKNTERILAILKTMIRLLFSFIKKWDRSYELKTLFQLTSIHFYPISPEVITVKKFSNQYKNPRSVLSSIN